MTAAQKEKTIQIVTYCVGAILIAFLWAPATQVIEYTKTLRFFAPETAHPEEIRSFPHLGPYQSPFKSKEP